MDENTIKSASKAQLRSLCKQHSVPYGKLTNDGMRKALRALLKPDDYVRERMSDTPVVKVIKKVTEPSVLDLLKLVPVGDSFSVKEIAKRTGATEQSVRTIIQSCNSIAPSNARFHRSGLRFECKRAEDPVRRTK